MNKKPRKKLPASLTFDPSIQDGGPVVNLLSEMMTDLVRFGAKFTQQYLDTYKAVLIRAALQHHAEKELGGNIRQDYPFPPDATRKDDFGLVCDQQQVSNVVTYVWYDAMRGVEIMVLGPTLVIGKCEMWAYNCVPFENALANDYCWPITIPMVEFHRARIPSGGPRFVNTGKMVRGGPEIA